MTFQGYPQWQPWQPSQPTDIVETPQPPYSTIVIIGISTIVSIIVEMIEDASDNSNVVVAIGGMILTVFIEGLVALGITLAYLKRCAEFAKKQ